MLKSLFSGVSGMKSQQTKMDVIGNNISNVSTTAFKSQTVNFKDMLSQTIEDASSPSGGKGGTNAKQVGLGVTVASISTNMTQGSLQPTSRASDLAIQGNGFFIVSQLDPHDPTKIIDTRYTRDGSFTLDMDGNLITSEGLHVVGTMVNSTNKVENGKMIVNDPQAEVDDQLKISGKTISSGLSAIVIPSEAEIHYESTSSAKFSSNSSDLQITFVGKGASNFAKNWTIKVGSGGTTGKGSIDNIDMNTGTITISGTYTDMDKLVSDFNNKIKEAGYPDCKVAIITPGKLELTGDGNLNLSTIPQMATNEVEINGFKFRIVGSADSIAAMNGDFKFEIDSSGATNISYDNSTTPPTLKIPAGTYPDTATFIDKVNNSTPSILPAGCKMVATSTIPSGWNPSGLVNLQDSESVKLTSYGIEKDGTIKAIYGEDAVQIGKIALANFQNPEGLLKMGGNTYLNSSNSGAPEIGDASENGIGSIQQSVLEMSNVDLASEFTDMIITSRAFQANSKTILTSDEMLQELIGLKR